MIKTMMAKRKRERERKKTSVSNKRAKTRKFQKI